MDIPIQITIEEYLEAEQVAPDKKEKVILAITDTLYQRNQKVIEFEKEKDPAKREQYLRSIEEYDAIMDNRVKQIIDGHAVDHNYEF